MGGLPLSQKDSEGRVAIVNQPVVSVVVVYYFAGPLFERCLDALANQTWDDFEILVVDNGSDGNSLSELCKAESRIKVITPSGNIGFAAANNLAATQAHGEWLATLNPDAYPDSRWLEALVEASRRNPGFSLFASAQFDHARPELLDGAGDPYSPLGFAWRGGKGKSGHLLPHEGKTFGPCAAAALYRKDVLLAAGGFDEAYFCYYEDVDLAFRMLLTGQGCLFIPTARVDHIGSAVSGAQSEFSVYHITRNRIWTFVKDMPGPLLAVLAVPAGIVLLRSLLMKDQRIKAGAIKDAIRGFPALLARRREVHAGRCVTWINVAAALTWSPSKTRTLAPDVRALPPAQPLGDERVCAVVVTYQSGLSLSNNLRTLLEQVTYLLVVDNGSDTASLESMVELSHQFKGRFEIICNECNLGLARAQNQGIARALDMNYPWVLLMDDDSLPAVDMVQSMLTAYREIPRHKPIGLLAPRIERKGIHYHQPYAISRHRGNFARRNFDDAPILTDLIFAIASGSLIPAAALKHVGVMCEDFFIDYVDVEFCLRLREAGYTIVAVEAARLAHHVGQTEECRLAGRSVPVTHHPSWRRYYIFRNRAFLWRAYGYRWPAWLAFDMAAAVFDLVRILLFEEDSRSKLTGALRGMWDGLRKRLSETARGVR